MRIPGLILFLLALSLTGCSSLIFPSSSPPVYYLLHYKPAALQCTHPFSKGVRIWEFGTASPYDHREMVVVSNGREISFSRDFQWAAPPGKMISDIMFRDLSGSALFPRVLTANDPGQVPLDMTGRILVFAWERDGETSRAVLDLEVSVTEWGAVNGIVFHKNYSLESAPVSGEGSSEDFERAMSTLVAEASGRIRQDLCLFAAKSAGQKRGDASVCGSDCANKYGPDNFQVYTLEKKF
jgi:ABC-type uncharacterized transport system auxiliary subunit